MVDLNLESKDTALTSSCLARVATNLVSSSILISGHSGNCQGWESSFIPYPELDSDQKLICPDLPCCLLFFLPT